MTLFSDHNQPSPNPTVRQEGKDGIRTDYGHT